MEVWVRRVGERREERANDGAADAMATWWAKVRAWRAWVDGVRVAQDEEAEHERVRAVEELVAGRVRQSAWDVWVARWAELQVGAAGVRRALADARVLTHR